MTLEEALVDKDLKAACREFLLARFDPNVVDDTWQQVCVEALQRKPGTLHFPSWEKARNYFVTACNRTAKDIYNRDMLNLTSMDDECGDEDPLNMIADPRLNVMETWCEEEEASIEAARQKAQAIEVQRLLATLPPTVRETFEVLLDKPDGKRSWAAQVQRKYKLTKAQAERRIKMALTYKPVFAALRVGRAPRPSSERRKTG